MQVQHDINIESVLIRLQQISNTYSVELTVTMAGIARRLAEVCCGSSAALSDTQDTEADRPDSSQRHGEDQQESADKKYVLEAGVKVLQAQAAAMWIGPAMCIGHVCTWCCCLPEKYSGFEQLAAITTLQSADVVTVRIRDLS